MLRQEKRILLVLVLIICVAAGLRIYLSVDNPLSGDEASGVLQATGQALSYQDRLPRDVVNIREIQRFIQWSEEFTIGDVLDSLRYHGMQPPFHHILLHYILRYGGNDALLLRMFSVIISLLSLIVLFLLGKRVFDEAVGLLAALFLGLSVYGVMYGTYVRPYQLAMLLSLVSTYVAVGLSEEGQLSLRNTKLYLYVFVVLMGLYTIYHFIFVFICHVVLFVISAWKRKKSFPVIFALVGMVIILYAPWFPAMIDQVRVVKGGSYYFHSEFRSLKFLTTFVNSIFTRYNPFIRIAAVKSALTVVVYAGILFGFYGAVRNKKTAGFAFAVVIYVLGWYVADRILGTNTLVISKLLFFLVPVALLFFANGIITVSKRASVRSILIVVFCCIMLSSSIGLCSEKPGIDGPLDSRTFHFEIKKIANQDQSVLIILKIMQRRFLFSLIHGIKAPIDVWLIQTDARKSDFRSMFNTRDYDVVLLVNFIRGKKRIQEFKPVEIKFISDYLEQREFDQTRVCDMKELSYRYKSTLTVLKKVACSTTGVEDTRVEHE